RAGDEVAVGPGAREGAVAGVTAVAQVLDGVHLAVGRTDRMREVGRLGGALREARRVVADAVVGDADDLRRDRRRPIVDPLAARSGAAAAVGPRHVEGPNAQGVLP